MARVIPSLQKLVFYLIILLVISIGTIILFSTFIDTQISLPTLIDKTAKIVLAVGFSLITIGVIRHFKPLVTQKIGEQVSTILQYVMFTIVVLIMSFAILDVLGTSASALLTGAGIISITAGLIISTFVGSILSGFLVFTNYKYRVGDNVMVNNIPGIIKEMSALVMRIQTDVGQITIPNSAIASGGVIITVVHKYEALKEGRMHYTVGDRVITSYMNEQGTVKEITPLNTTVQLDSGKEITFLNNSVLSGAVAIAKITQSTILTEKKAA